MIAKIICPSCQTLGQFSVDGGNFKGPYRCWKCRTLYTLDMVSYFQKIRRSFKDYLLSSGLNPLKFESGYALSVGFLPTSTVNAAGNTSTSIGVVPKISPSA